MLAYRKERIENAICYFAMEHLKRKGEPLYQTFLYKYLAFLEFSSLEEIGKPVFDIEFKAMGNGPVPMEIYNKRKNYETELFVFIPLEEEKIIIVPKRDPDLDYFSEYEIEEMNALLLRFTKKSIKSKDICIASHRIKAWKKAWKRRHNSEMHFVDTFDDLKSKPEEELTLQEERFLLYTGSQQLCR